MAKYDIFISYRREGGYDTAKHLYDLLSRDGYRVSFDIDTLRNGDFDKSLLKRIDECKDFILIVDSHAFDRTLNPNFNPNNDWLRQELAHALKKGKNIIPIFLNSVKEFPANLPKDIVGVVKKNGPKYDRYYFNDFYKKLCSSFLTAKSPKKYTKDITFIILGLLVASSAFVLLRANLSNDASHVEGASSSISTFVKMEPDLTDDEAARLFIDVAGRTPVYAITYTEDTPILIGLVNENVMDGDMPESKFIFKPSMSLIRYHQENGVWIKDYSKAINFERFIGEDDAEVFCIFDETSELYAASQQMYLYFHIARSCGGNASADITNDYVVLNLIKGNYHFLEYVEHLDSHYTDNGSLYKENRYPKGIEDLLTYKLSESNIQKTK